MLAIVEQKRRDRRDGKEHTCLLALMVTAGPFFTALIGCDDMTNGTSASDYEVGELRDLRRENEK